MTDDAPTDPLLDRLAAPPAPATDLVPRVVDAWFRTEGPLGDVLVVLGHHGVRYLRDADRGEETFRAEYHHRFHRPLVAHDGRPPRGLAPALRGRGAGPALDLEDASPFERTVLRTLAAIPAGETRPYGWLAREAGRPRAVRAVGTVLARNPLPLLLPCHRVTRADGGLGEYLFGSAAKADLLRDEGADVDELEALAAAGTTLVGSDTTGVVCFPSCHHARRITARHRHGFRTAAAALEAGYRPCRHCRPTVPVAPGPASG